MSHPRNDRPRVDFHEGTLRFWNVGRDFVRKAMTGIPMAADDRDDCFRCDAVHAVALRRRLAESLAGEFDWDVVDDSFRLAFPSKESVRLRADQVEAIEAFTGADRRGLVVMPTGTGKTVVAIDLVRRFSSSTLVVVPVRDLMYQWHEKIRSATGVDAGLIGDGVHRVSPISVTTYDSAAIHMSRIGSKFRFIIFDEVHHLAGPWRSDAARMSAAEFRLGLTATLPDDPDRLSVLHELVGPTVYRQAIGDASGKTLADYHVRRITVEMSEKEAERYRELSALIQRFVHDQRQVDPSFRWEDTYKLAGQVEIDTGRATAADQALKAFRAKRRIEEHAGGKFRVLEDLFRLHAGQPVIVFTGSNVMARRISLRFLVPCLLSHCGKRERREWLEGFAAGRYPVLVANRVLDEGVDLPEVKVAIVLGGMSSRRQAIQRLGRVLRKNNRDQKAVLYEVVTEATKEIQRSRDRRRNDAYRKR